MAATDVPPPPLNRPFLDGAFVSTPWQIWFSALRDRTGGAGDKVEAAHAAALAAVPQTTQVVAGGGLQVGGALNQNVPVTLYVASTTVAMLPVSGLSQGDWAYAQNGRKPGEGAGAGTGVPCFWSGSSWIAVTSGAAVTS
jgi:hypothetical protein